MFFSPWSGASPFLMLLLPVILIFADVHVACLIAANSSELFLSHLSRSPDSNLALIFCKVLLETQTVCDGS